METCDECGPSVAAKELVALPSGRRLTFCGHCANFHRAKLEATGALLYPIREA